MSKKLNDCELLGESRAMVNLRSTIRKLKGKTSVSILILGESGTGKELVARELHNQEGSDTRPYVIANMPAIPPQLISAELFGVEKGAYTDAHAARDGKFELANRGDIFLDEIGDLPFDAQAKLLRVLQEKTFSRVGCNKERKVSVRVISATNRSLHKLIDQGTFRADLIYRLGDIVINLPPLRERKEDIPLLANYFVRKHEELYCGNKAELRLSERAIHNLCLYRWPGNVRQLESTIKRTLVMAVDPLIYDAKVVEMMPDAVSVGGIPSNLPFKVRMEMFEREVMEEILEKNHWNNEAAIVELGLSRATFYRRIGELKIAQRKYRKLAPPLTSTEA